VTESLLLIIWLRTNAPGHPQCVRAFVRMCVFVCVCARESDRAFTSYHLAEHERPRPPVQPFIINILKIPLATTFTMQNDCRADFSEHTCIHMYTSMYINIYVYNCIHVYIYIHIHTHTNKHSPPASRSHPVQSQAPGKISQMSA